MPEDSQEAAESGDDGEVLTPNDLDITEDESVVEIDDGRFVISPGGGSPTIPEEPSDRDGGDARELDEDDDAGGDPLDLDSVHGWLETHLARADAEYAFDVTASFHDRSAQKALYSNDVVTTFENLVVWFAHHAGGETPVEDVIGILLTESNVTVRYPADSVREFVDASDLRPDDSIEDLLDAVEDSGGITFPPSDG